MIGKAILHYKIIEKLGEGGMGIVYKAEDTKLKRPVAIKFLPHHISADSDERKRFEVEAQAAAALNHTNIATIHAIEHFTDPSKGETQTFLVMEYISGKNLKQFTVADNQSAINYIIQMAEGLQIAHKKGIVHRDIKSSNIMVGSDDKIKITDFGLAKFCGSADLTRDGTTVGTAAYMSPEQTRGGEVDQRSDLWSLGVVMYEMLYHQLPFKGEYEQAMQYAIVNEKFEHPGSTKTLIERRLISIIEKCLQKNPNDRYQSASELIVDLTNIEKTDFKIKINTRKLNKWVLTGVLSIAVLVLAVKFFFTEKNKEMSIAVLPFENMSGDSDQNYLSDGMTEDILNQIGKISSMRVISSLASRRYRNTDKSASVIGNELDVANVLTGSIRRINDKLRIVAHLTDTDKEEQIWTATFDKDITDIFSIQSEVALNIATELQAELLPGEKQRISSAPTENSSAYDYFLRANEALSKYTRENNEQAVVFYKEAVKLDPRFSAAWAGLAGAYVGRFSRFGLEHAWVDSALLLAEKAIKMNPELAEGYSAAALAYSKLGRTEKALSYHQKALEFNPNYYPSVGNLGATYKNIGQYDQALKWYKKADDILPAGYNIKVNIGVIYSYFSDFEQSDKWFHEAKKLNPGAKQVIQAMAHSYLARGDNKNALALIDTLMQFVAESWLVWDWMADIARFNRDLEKVLEFHQQALQNNPSGGNDWFSFSHIGLADYYRRRGAVQKSDSLLKAVEQRRMEQIENGVIDQWLYYDMAVINAIRNDARLSAKWLNRAAEHGWADYRFAKRDPWFERVVNDPVIVKELDKISQALEQMANSSRRSG